MRILFDQGTPAPLRHHLAGHSVSTASELGWDTLQNGDLLAAAEPLFDVFITTDQGLQYQQNLSGRKLAILVLPTTNWPRIRRHVDMVLAAVHTLQHGEFREIDLPN
jgi:hypothetical protein